MKKLKSKSKQPTFPQPQLPPADINLDNIFVVYLKCKTGNIDYDAGPYSLEIMALHAKSLLENFNKEHYPQYNHLWDYEVTILSDFIEKKIEIEKLNAEFKVQKYYEPGIY